MFSWGRRGLHARTRFEQSKPMLNIEGNKPIICERETSTDCLFWEGYECLKNHILTCAVRTVINCEQHRTGGWVHSKAGIGGGCGRNVGPGGGRMSGFPSDGTINATTAHRCTCGGSKELHGKSLTTQRLTDVLEGNWCWRKGNTIESVMLNIRKYLHSLDMRGRWQFTAAWCLGTFTCKFSTSHYYSDTITFDTRMHE